MARYFGFNLVPALLLVIFTAIGLHFIDVLHILARGLGTTLIHEFQISNGYLPNLSEWNFLSLCKNIDREKL